MIRQRHIQLAPQYNLRLQQHESANGRLPGVRAAAKRNAFIFQVIDSVWRIDKLKNLDASLSGPKQYDPVANYRDPLGAAILHRNLGHHDEACWLVFLATHFGWNHDTGWRLANDVYCGLGTTPFWTWQRFANSPQDFIAWLQQNLSELRRRRLKFGNHRKYTSLHPTKKAGTGNAFLSYQRWVQPFGSHQALFQRALLNQNDDAKGAFHELHGSMKAVASFGRTGKFDYLAMIGNLNLAAIVPARAYISGSTGPVVGARLLLERAGQHLSSKEMESRLAILARDLQVGMQEIEDSLCNWQKSASQYLAFGG